MRKKIAFLLFLLTGVYLIIVLSRDLWRVLSSKNRLVEAESRAEELTGEQLQLKKELAEVESEAFVEKEARDKLLLAREGEVVLLLSEQKSEIRNPKSEKDGERQDLANWQKWLKVFGF